jgi:hypothetical protein
MVAGRGALVNAYVNSLDEHYLCPVQFKRLD